MTKSVFTRKYDYFRALLIAEREAAGVTQVELGKRICRPQSFISKYERGERRLDVIEFLEIAHALGINLNSFLSKIERKERG